MAFDLGQARGEIVIDARGATRGIREAQGALNGLSQSTQTVGFGLSALGQSLIGIGGAATLGIGAAVREASNFEEALANVATISETVAANTQFFGEQIIDVAARTNRSASDLADGFYQIVSAAIDGDQALYVLEAASIAANAGLTNTTTAANILTSVLNSGVQGLDLATFSLQDLTNINDILFQTVNRGVFTYEQLATALGDSLPLANGLGVNLTELGAAFAIITRNGQTASEASTQINAVFSALLKPSDSLQQILSGLGYESGSAAIEALGFAGALEAIEGAITAAGGEADDFSGNIRAVRGLLGLTQSAAGDFSEEVENIGASTGATNRALEQQQKTFAFALTSLRNALERLAISVGTTLLPILTRAVNFLTGVVKAIDNIPGPVKAVIAVMVGLAAATAVVLGVMAIFASQLIAIAAAFSVIRRNGLGLNGILGGLLRPVEALGDGVTNLTHASRAAGTSTSRFSGALGRFSKPASASALRIKSVVNEIKALEKALPNAAPRITELSASMTALQSSLKTVPAAFGRLATNIAPLPRLLAPLPNAISPLIGPLTALADPIKKVGTGFRAINSVSVDLPQRLSGIQAPLAAMLPTITAMGDDLKKVGAGFRGINSVAADLPNRLLAIEAPLQKISPLFTSMAKDVAGVGRGFRGINSVAADLPVRLSAMEKPLQSMAPILSSIAPFAKDVGTGFSRMSKAAADLPTNLPKIAGPLLSLVTPLKQISADAMIAGKGFSRIGSGVRELGKADVGKITGLIDNLGVSVRDFQTSVGNAPKLFASMGNGIRNMGKYLPDAVTNLPLLAKGLNDIDGPLSNVAVSLADTPSKIGSLARSFSDLSRSLPAVTGPLQKVAVDLARIDRGIGNASTNLPIVANSFKSMGKYLPGVAAHLPTISSALVDIAANSTSASGPLGSVAMEMANLSKGIGDSPKKLISLSGAITTISTNAQNAGSGLSSVVGALAGLETRLSASNPLVATFSKSISTIAGNAVKLQNSLGPVVGQIEYLGLALSSYTGGFTALADDVLNLGAAVDLMGKSLTGKKALIDGFAKSLSGLAGTASSFDLSGITRSIDDLAIQLNAADGIFDNIRAGVDGLDQRFASLATGMSSFSSQLPKIASTLPSVADGMMSLAGSIKTINPAKLKYIAEGVNDLGKLSPDSALRISATAKSLGSLSTSLGAASFDRLATISKGIRSVGVESTAANTKIANITKTIGSLQTKLPNISSGFTTLSKNISVTKTSVDGFAGSVSNLAKSIPKINKDLASALRDIDSAIPDGGKKLSSVADGLSRFGDAIDPKKFSSLKALPAELGAATTAITAYTAEATLAGKATTSFHTRMTTLIAKATALVPALNAATAAQIEFCVAANCDTGVRNFGGLTEVVDDVGGAASRNRRAVAGLSDEVMGLGAATLVAVDSFDVAPRFPAPRTGTITRWGEWSTAVDNAAGSAAKAEQRFIDLNGRVANAPDPRKAAGRWGRLVENLGAKPVGIVAKATPNKNVAKALVATRKGLVAYARGYVSAIKFASKSAKSTAKFIKTYGILGKTLKLVGVTGAFGLTGLGKAIASTTVRAAKSAKIWGVLSRGVFATTTGILRLGVGVTKTVVPFKLIGRWLKIWQLGFKALLLPIKATILLIKGLVSAIFFLLSPLGLLTAAIAFFAVAFIQNWFGIRDKVTDAIDGITKAVGGFIDIIKAAARISKINSKDLAGFGGLNQVNLRQTSIASFTRSIAAALGLSQDAADDLNYAIIRLVANISGLRGVARKAEVSLGRIFGFIFAPGISDGELPTIKNFQLIFRYLSDVFGGNVANSIIAGATNFRLALIDLSNAIDQAFGRGTSDDIAGFFTIEGFLLRTTDAARRFVRFVRFQLIPVLGRMIVAFLKVATVLTKSIAFFIRGDYENAFRTIGTGIRDGLMALISAADDLPWGSIFEAAKSVLKTLFSVPVQLGAVLISLIPELASGIWGAAGNAYDWIKGKLLGGSGPVGDNTGISQTQFMPISFGTVLLTAAAALGGVIAKVAADFNDWVMKKIFGDDYATNQELPQNIGSLVLDGAVSIGSTISDWVASGATKIGEFFAPLYDLVTVDIGTVTVDGSIIPDEGIATDTGFGLGFLGSIIDSLWAALDDGQILLDALEWANGVLDRISEWMLMVDFDENALFGIGAKLGSAIGRALRGEEIAIDEPITFNPEGGSLVQTGFGSSSINSIGGKILAEVIRLLVNVLENRAAIAVFSVKVAAALGAFIGGVLAAALLGVTVNFDQESVEDLKKRIYRIYENTLLTMFLGIINEVDIVRLLKENGVPGIIAEAIGGATGIGTVIGAIPIEEMEARLNVENWIFSTTPGSAVGGTEGRAAIWTALLAGLESGDLVLGSDGRIYTSADFEVAAEAFGVVDVTWQVTTPGGEVDALQEAIDAGSTDALGDWTEYDWGIDPNIPVPVTITVDPQAEVSDASGLANRRALGKRVGDDAAASVDTPEAESGFATLRDRFGEKFSGAINSGKNKTLAQTAATALASISANSAANSTSKFISSGMQLGNGLAVGLTASTGVVVAAAIAVANAANNAFRTQMQMRSPSRVWSTYGEYMGEGLAIGMESSGSLVARASDVLAAMATPTAVPYQTLSGVGAQQMAASGPVFNNAVIYMPNAETAEAVATYFMNYSRSRW